MSPATVFVCLPDGGPGFVFDRLNLEGRKDPPHFGSVIVDTLADRWGLSVEGRKAVWFEVDAPGGYRPTFHLPKASQPARSEGSIVLAIGQHDSREEVGVALILAGRQHHGTWRSSP